MIKAKKPGINHIANSLKIKFSSLKNRSKNSARKNQKVKMIMARVTLKLTQQTTKVHKAKSKDINSLLDLRTMKPTYNSKRKY